MAKGYSARRGFSGGGGMAQQQAQMQQKLMKMQQDMAKMQEELANKTYIAAAGGGVVSAEVNGQHEVVSITTQKAQTLCLDGKDALAVKGRRVAIVDDVISTGESLSAIERLLEKAGAEIVAKAAILAEGEAAGRGDIIFLEELPLFPL